MNIPLMTAQNIIPQDESKKKRAGSTAFEALHPQIMNLPLIIGQRGIPSA
jgi:hypothetical protein